MDVGSTIVRVMQEVALEQQRELSPLTDNAVLAEAGLDSLCFAIIVARLEDEFGVDPFTASEEIYFPVTLAEFVALYANAGV
jgi:acyl carrier protein